jgi:hypothetical protein
VSNFKYISILILILSFGCKQRKAINQTGSKNFNPISLDSLLNVNSYEWDYIKANAEVSLSGEAINQNVNATINMERNKIIWISARVMGMEGLRIYMLEDSITVINRLGRSYYRLSWNEAGNYIGAKLDLQITQNLLIGKLLFNKDSTYKFTNDSTLYWTERLVDNMVYRTHMDSFTHKIDSSYFRGAKTGKNLQLKYSKFSNIGMLMLPLKISLRAKDGLKRFNGTIKYENIKTEPFEWSARVPASFKRKN